MPDTGNRAPLGPNDTTEQKMRRALGLNTKGGGQTPQQRPEQARARHRFVQDGGVPVTVLNPRHDGESSAFKERIGEMEHMLEIERGQHANTRRTLQELQSAHQALETRMVHADLAHQDALAQERQLRIAAQEALAAVPPPALPRRMKEPVAKAAVQKSPETAEDAPQAAAAPVVSPVVPPVVPRKRGRPRSAVPKEPKPLRWWTPSFKTKTKA